MKRVILLVGLIGLLLLTACGKKDASKYVDVSFQGVDSVGNARYSMDVDKLLEDVFNYDPDSDFPDEETYEAMNDVASSYKVKVEPESGLSNGDKVTITVSVDDKKTKKIKGGKKEFTVEGLEDAKDVMEYVEVSFSGLDTQGKVKYDINEGELIADIFGQDVSDNETQAEIDKLKAAYEIEVSEEEGLSNGDKVTVKVKVDKDKTKLIKNSEKELTVVDLGEATKLTTEEVEKHLVLNFNGVSGKGVAQIDNTFSSPLNNFNFQIANDGELKNGDEATLVWDEEMVERLNNNGYIVDKDFKPVFKVDGLGIIAEKATDIKNLDDIKRMIEEELNKRYKSASVDKSYGTVYKMKEEKIMYRQFDPGEGSTWSSSLRHGSLIGIYSVEEYSGGNDQELKSEYTVTMGYSGILLDKDNKANAAKIDLFHDRKDDAYSVESVIQIHEGNGYTEVKAEKKEKKKKE